MSSVFQEITGEFKGVQDQLTLCVSVLVPIGSYVWSTIIEHDIALLMFKHLLKCVITNLGGNIANERLSARYSFDLIEIHTDDSGVDRHELLGNLHPTSWRRT